MFQSIVVGHRRLRDRRQGGARGDRAGQGGRRLDRARVAPTSRCRASGCARRRAQAPEDLQWMVNPREDVDATLREAAERVEAAGVTVTHLRARGRPGRRDPRRRRGARRRPDRGRQQGHDRRQAVPARLGAEQGLPPRALLGADHPDHLGGAGSAGRVRARPRRRAARRRSASPGPADAEVARRRLQPRRHGRRRRVGGRARRRRSRARRRPTRAARPSRCP